VHLRLNTVLQQCFHCTQSGKIKSNYLRFFHNCALILSETLALYISIYESFTYLLTYLHNWISNKIDLFLKILSLIQGAAKSGPLKFFTVFSATLWDFNMKFQSFIY